MVVALSMPQFGQSMVDGTVSAWLKAEGDMVARDEPLVTVSTEKIDTDLPAPEAGAVLRICVPPGTTVDVGTPLAYIGEPGDTLPVIPQEPSATRSEAATLPPLKSFTPSVAQGPQSGDGPMGFLSPVVNRMLHEHGLDPTQISGSGRNGRITRKDVQAIIANRAEMGVSAELLSELQPLTPMRKAIAEHMALSVQTSAHVTTFFEVDMGAVVQHREQQRDTLAQEGVRLSLMPYFMKAAVQSLQQVPQVNSSLLAKGLAVHGNVHLGVAVAVPNGLVVPVIHSADRLDLQGLAQGLANLTTKAHTRQLRKSDLEGSTFCITNHGTNGSLAGTPIIHQPNAAILGIGAVVKRPVVRGSSSLMPHSDDAILIRPICVLSFSFDHRILDGAVADSFLAHVRDTLEGWQ